jgi:hypothetical protein
MIFRLNHQERRLAAAADRYIERGTKVSLGLQAKLPKGLLQQLLAHRGKKLGPFGVVLAA